MGEKKKVKKIPYSEKHFCRKNRQHKQSSLSAGVFVMLAAIVFLSVPILGNWMIVNAEAAEYKMANLTQKETVGLIEIKEEAEIESSLMARELANEKERKDAIALEKWLKAQKKRVAKEKAKRAEEEAKKAIEEEAEKNTKATYGGSGWSGQPLTKGRGTITGPSGKETYYNLNMSGVVRIMRGMGFSEEEYPYEVREDGVKTLGGYVMVAANLRLRPRGSFIQTSCGTGIVCDTGGFAARNPTQLDLAVSW